MMSELGVDTATIQWITSAYLLVLSVTIPLFPVLKSRYPLRCLFSASTIAFVAGTILCCTSVSFPQLLTGRIIQGLGTGVAMPLMFNIVVDQVSLDHMGTMMGVASLIISSVPAIGPAYGGVVLEEYGWRAMFAFAIPLLGAAFLAGLACIRQTTELDRRPFDVTGFLFVAFGFLLIVVGVNRLSNGGITALVTVLLLVGTALLVQFVKHVTVLRILWYRLKLFPQRDSWPRWLLSQVHPWHVSDMHGSFPITCKWPLVRAQKLLVL